MLPQRISTLSASTRGGGPLYRAKPTGFAASVVRPKSRFGASLQFALDLVRDFAICASNEFRYGAEVDATDRTTGTFSS